MQAAVGEPAGGVERRSRLFSLTRAVAETKRQLGFRNCPTTDANPVLTSFGATNLFLVSSIADRTNYNVPGSLIASSNDLYQVEQSLSTMSGNIAGITSSPWNFTGHNIWWAPAYAGNVWIGDGATTNILFTTDGTAAFASSVSADSLVVSKDVTAANFWGSGVHLTGIAAATATNGPNGSPLLTGNQSVTITASGDATGSASGATSITITLTVTNGANLAGVLASAIVGAIAQATHSTNADKTTWGGTLPGLSGTNVWTGTNTFQTNVVCSAKITTSALTVGSQAMNPSGIGMNDGSSIGSSASWTFYNTGPRMGAYGNVTPWSNLGFDLGSTSYVWKNLYASNGIFNGTLTATNGFGIWPTNAAPSNVTIGITQPDFWRCYTNTSGTKVFEPGWINH